MNAIKNYFEPYVYKSTFMKIDIENISNLFKKMFHFDFVM